MYIHIGGSFKHDNNDNLRYVDGECDTWQVNPDLLTVCEFYEKVRIGRYDVALVESISYLEPNKSLDDGLKQIIGDDTVREVFDVMKGYGEVHIYVDHIQNFAKIVLVSLALMPPALGDPLELADGFVVMLVGVGSMKMRHLMRLVKGRTIIVMNRMEFLMRLVVIGAQNMATTLLLVVMSRMIVALNNLI
ncbi:hypothetical protein SLA2020_107780 [Shorea laevis]